MLIAYNVAEVIETMQTQTELKTAQDYLDAADREFEKGDALAGTERLWAAMTHTLKGVAVKKGWAYDADDLYPVVEKIAKMDERLGEMLFSSYGAAEGYPEPSSCRLSQDRGRRYPLGPASSA